MSPTSLLGAVTLVLKPFPAVAALDHVATRISYLDDSMVTPLDEVCSIGSSRLLNRIWENSYPEAETVSRSSLCQYLRADIHFYRFQFTNSLRTAAKRGDLSIIQWILDHFLGCTAGVEVVEEAARHGRSMILQYLLEHGRCGEHGEDERNAILWGGDDMINVVIEGHGQLAQWLYENTPDARRNLDSVMRYAVRQGDRSLVQWLLDVVYEAGPLLPPPSMDDAAAGGHMEMLQWIYEEEYGGCSDNALEGAVSNGRLDMVQWPVENGITKGARKPCKQLAVKVI